MNPEQMDRLTNVFRTLFNQSDLVLRDDMTAADVAGWDSFNHVNLIILIEEEFNVRFTTDEVSSMANVGDLIRILTRMVGSIRLAA
jgi:acyl carrier protein